MGTVSGMNPPGCTTSRKGAGRDAPRTCERQSGERKLREHSREVEEEGRDEAVRSSNNHGYSMCQKQKRFMVQFFFQQTLNTGSVTTNCIVVKQTLHEVRA